MLYSAVPRSSQWPSTRIFAPRALFRQLETFSSVPRAFSSTSALSNAKYTAFSSPTQRAMAAALAAPLSLDVTQRPFWHARPWPHCASVSHSLFGCCAAAQRPFWHCPPPGQSAFDSHSGRGAHLLSRHTNPALQSPSAPHSWQRPWTHTLPYPC